MNGKFNWFRQDILVMAGVIIQNPQIILEIRNEKAVWMQKDSNGYYRLNMAIKDSEGKLVLEIIDSDWVTYNERVIDVICPPSGKELSLISKDHKTNLAIRFDDVPIEEFKKRLFLIQDNMIKSLKKNEMDGVAQKVSFLKEKENPLKK